MLSSYPPHVSLYHFCVRLTQGRRRRFALTVDRSSPATARWGFTSAAIQVGVKLIWSWNDWTLVQHSNPFKNAVAILGTERFKRLSSQHLSCTSNLVGSCLDVRKMQYVAALLSSASCTPTVLSPGCSSACFKLKLHIPVCFLTNRLVQRPGSATQTLLGFHPLLFFFPLSLRLPPGRLLLFLIYSHLQSLGKVFIPLGPFSPISHKRHCVLLGFYVTGQQKAVHHGEMVKLEKHVWGCSVALQDEGSGFETGFCMGTPVFCHSPKTRPADDRTDDEPSRGCRQGRVYIGYLVMN